MIFGSPVHAAPTVESDDIDLPPLDGATDEDITDESDSDDLDPVPADAGKDAFDDSTGTDDPVDLEEIDPLDGDSLVTSVERERAEDLDEDAEFLEDRGSDPTLESESMLADNDGLGVGDEDFGLGEEPPLLMDGGEEGPREADDELREEDLPALDADDLGDGDEADFFDVDAAAVPPVPWAEPRWETRSVASIGAVIAVVPLLEFAVAIGVDPAQLWRIEQDRAELSTAQGAPREGWSALRGNRKTGTLWLDTEAGTFISHDGGRRFQRDADSARPANALADLQRDLDAHGVVDLHGCKLTAAAIVDEAGTLLTALRRPGDATSGTWLVRIPRTGGTAHTVGVIRGAVWDLAWDEGGGCAWVASDDGVTIFTPPAS